MKYLLVIILSATITAQETVYRIKNPDTVYRTILWTGDNIAEVFEFMGRETHVRLMGTERPEPDEYDDYYTSNPCSYEELVVVHIGEIIILSRGAYFVQKTIPENWKSGT